MTRKAVAIHMALTCAMAVALPGRFAFALIVAFELCFLMLTGTLFRSLLKILKMKELKSICLCTFIVSMTMLFREIVCLLMPETALQLSFVFYLPAISTFSSVFLFDEQNLVLKDELKVNLVPVLVFSAYILIQNLLRDILGYGTFTLPAKGKMLEVVLIKSERISFLSFFATIPGAIMISSLVMAFYLTFENRMEILKKADIK